MCTPLAILLPLVAALNDPTKPCSFEVSGESIFAKCDTSHPGYDGRGSASPSGNQRLRVSLNGKKSSYVIARLDDNGTGTLHVPVDTSGVYEPLFTFLEGNGYCHKQTLLSTLLGR